MPVLPTIQTSRLDHGLRVSPSLRSGRERRLYCGTNDNHRDSAACLSTPHGLQVLNLETPEDNSAICCELYLIFNTKARSTADKTTCSSTNLTSTCELDQCKFARQ